MAKFNGTGILVYSNGTEIACQTGLSLSLQQALLPATTKNSAGWEEHINGQRSFSIPFEALQSTAGLSSKALYDYIIGRTNLLIFILGFGVPIIGEADMESSTVNAPNEGTTGLSGTFKGNRQLFQLRGTHAALLTAVTASSSNYDTLTTSVLKITSAINSSAGTKYYWSNSFTIANAGVYYVVFYLTLNSGAVPDIMFHQGGGGSHYSNVISAVAGVNVIRLVSTAAVADAKLHIYNITACNWSTSNIYVFRQS